MRFAHLASCLAICCPLAEAGTGTYTGEASFDSVTELRWRLEASWSTSAGELTFSPQVWDTRWSQTDPGLLDGNAAMRGVWQLSNVQGISAANPLTLSFEIKASFLDSTGRPVNLASLFGNGAAGPQSSVSWYTSVYDNMYSRAEHTPVVQISAGSLTRQVDIFDQNDMPLDVDRGSTRFGHTYASQGGFCNESCDQLSSSYTMRMEVVYVPGSYRYASSDPNCKDVSCMPIANYVFGAPWVDFNFQIASHVPEPSQAALLLLGMTAFAFRRRST